MRSVALLAVVAALAGCKREPAKPPPPQLIFEDEAGRRLTRDDLEGFTGRVNWEIVGGDAVPPEAARLHKEARAAGGRGEYAHAIELLEEARRLAPAWPYPAYDEAYTYELQGDLTKATALYEEVERLSPRGFFTCKTSLDYLRRERAGAVPAGLCKEYATIEWLGDDEAKRAALEKMTAAVPGFPPAWKDLATLLEDEPAKLRAIERGLAGVPDGETRGMLLINKALVLDHRGDRDGAISILGTLALDPASTLGTAVLAKAALANLLTSSAR